MNSHPLVVDLDGTLIQTDMLHESALSALRHNPFHFLHITYWLAQGKAILKRQLSKFFQFDPAILPYHADLLTWLKEQHATGRPLILCTAADDTIAQTIAAHLGIFTEVIASNGVVNLSGKKKAHALRERFGLLGFDYVGNSRADLVVWQSARKAIIVTGSTSLMNQASSYCEVERVFTTEAKKFSVWAKTLRIQQWLKNLLLFIPILAAHQLNNLSLWFSMGLAFCAFCLCASAVYITNDLLDLQSDRQHPRKRLRPFAAGRMPAWVGAILAPVLLLTSILCAWFVNLAFLACLLTYYGLTCAYSWRLKRLILLDSLTLAILYTLRIIAGNAAAGLAWSFWLLAFSIFLFLSLAFVKRYAELRSHVLQGKQKLHGRGYHTDDAPLVQMFGVTSGYVAALVLALYINSEAIQRLYHSPEIIWGTVPVLIFWVSWMWMQAHRGHMHDDPVEFALKNRTSLLAGLFFTIILIIGSVGLSW